MLMKILAIAALSTCAAGAVSAQEVVHYPDQDFPQAGQSRQTLPSRMQRPLSMQDRANPGPLAEGEAVQYPGEVPPPAHRSRSEARAEARQLPLPSSKDDPEVTTRA